MALIHELLDDAKALVAKLEAAVGEHDNATAPVVAETPAPGVTPDGSSEGPQPTPPGTPENVVPVGESAPVTPASADGSGVQTSSDLQ